MAWLVVRDIARRHRLLSSSSHLRRSPLVGDGLHKAGHDDSEAGFGHLDAGYDDLDEVGIDAGWFEFWIFDFGCGDYGLNGSSG